MSRLIDADALYERAYKLNLDYKVSDVELRTLKRLLMEEPTAVIANDAERKKGKWIPQDYNKTTGMVSTAVYYYPKCSVCGQCANYTNFCPNCGADMREEKENG